MAVTVNFTLMQCHLTYTVDGVIGVVNLGRYTVTGAPHNHTATKDSAVVGALYGIHHTSGIDTAYTGYLKARLLFGGQAVIFIGCNLIIYVIS